MDLNTPTPETDVEKATKKANYSLDYELLDLGNGNRLERFGNNTVIRPELDAIGDRAFPALWDQASCVIRPQENQFSVFRKPNFCEPWTSTFTLSIGGVEKNIVFNLQTETSQNVGMFPEHAPQWGWIAHRVATRVAKVGSCNVLNLFGYTGGASLAAAAAGANVCHIDSSSSALTLGKQNQQASGLAEAPIRWLKDDVMTFLRREIRRKSVYDAIIMDPPAFGRGPNGETFNLKNDFEELLYLTGKVLVKQPTFLIFNQYPKNIDIDICEETLREKFTTMQLSKQQLEVTTTQTKRRLPCATAFMFVPKRK